MSRIIATLTHRISFILADATWFNNFMASPFGLALVIFLLFVLPVSIVVFVVPVFVASVVSSLYNVRIEPQFISILAIVAVLWVSRKGDF